jgi:hypothetical protein
LIKTNEGCKNYKRDLLPLELLGKKYLRRFAIDHWYRFIKQRLPGTLPSLSTPHQWERWSDLMPLITWQLWRAKDIVQENLSAMAKTAEEFKSCTGCTINVWTFSGDWNTR